MTLADLKSDRTWIFSPIREDQILYSKSDMDHINEVNIPTTELAGPLSQNSIQTLMAMS